MIDPSPYLFVLETAAVPVCWATVFGNDHPVELEVGSGKGLFLANAASTCPDRNFFGIELARKYARRAADRVAKRNLGNVGSCRATPCSSWRSTFPTPV